MENPDVQTKLEGWLDSTVLLLPNILTALIVFILFFVGGKLARKLVLRATNKVGNNRAASNLLALSTFMILVVIGAMVALNILNLGGAATSVLAGAGIVGVALGFAFQDIAANFISGIVLAFQKPFKIGDLVQTNDFFGIVRKINLRATEIETLEGQYVFIPNREILLNPLTDYTHNPQRRVDVPVGVAYGTDLKDAKDTVLAVVKKLPNVSETKPIDAYYEEFGDSSINLVVRFWINFAKQPDYLEAKSAAVIGIKAAFDKKSINIPFPIRTLDLPENFMKKEK